MSSAVSELRGDRIRSRGSFLELVQARAQRSPRLSAVRLGDNELDYGELWDASGALARGLVSAGIEPGSIVGVVGDRSPKTVASILGVLRAGAAYLPLDVSYPSQRLAFMLENAQVQVVLGEMKALSESCANVVDPDALGRARRGKRNGGSTFKMSDAPSDLCYVLYTSGSTGEPKGVMMERQALSNLVHWQLRDSRCGAGARTLGFAPLSFDVSFQEIFSTLSAGGCLVCIDEKTRADPERLWSTLVGERIDRLYLPFIALQALALVADGLPRARLALTEVITAGEQLVCDERVSSLFAERLQGCRLTNQYGPTETHVVSRHHLPDDPAMWPSLPPIGTPIDNVSIRLLGEHGEPVARGECGIMHVLGSSLGRGYLSRQGLTAARFVPDENGTRAYRTGDFARLDDGGLLQFLGREDEQIKIRGFRVEPAEVESALLLHESVHQAAVVAKGATALERDLVAFIAARPNELTSDDLRDFLSERLPRHLVPSRLIIRDRLPLTPSGKVDRSQLRKEAQLHRVGPPPTKKNLI